MFPLLFGSIEVKVELNGYLWEYDETHKPFLRKMDTYVDEESFTDNFKKVPRPPETHLWILPVAPN